MFNSNEDCIMDFGDSLVQPSFTPGRNIIISCYHHLSYYHLSPSDYHLRDSRGLAEYSRHRVSPKSDSQSSSSRQRFTDRV